MLEDASASRSGRTDRLRHVRHERGFEPRFFERHAAFWPIEPAARVFADRPDWPDPREYALSGAGEPLRVRFELARKKRRRRGEPRAALVRAELYDAMITLQGVVPTRPRMWHDYLNALVWATYPRAKLALHARQHAAIEKWVPEGATQLPNARTRELDALALVDEGGVLLLDDGATVTPMFFGHALYEGLVFGQPAMVARAVLLDARAAGPLEAGWGRGRSPIVKEADRLLAAALTSGRVTSPDELPRWDAFQERAERAEAPGPRCF